MADRTPEEIAEGLSEAMVVALRRSIDPQLREPGRDLLGATHPTAQELKRRGLVRRDMGRWGVNRPAWVLTDLGRAVADVLAKRGAK